MKQNFDELIENLKPSIADYKYYTNFDKVYKNVRKYNVELNILNSLISSENIENDFIDIINKYPETLKVIPMLLAVRKLELLFFDGRQIKINFSTLDNDFETYVKMMRESGLFYLLEKTKVKSLHDYLTGVEVGLDSNARKNRTGTAMENIVESFISQLPGITYHKEIKKNKIKSKYNIDLDSFLDEDTKEDIADKRFDFVIKTDKKLYIIETNFYGSGGSKLNETSRSYKSLAADINSVDDVEFIWITDGKGWKTAKNGLKETYDTLDGLYTLKDLEEGKLESIIK